MDTKFKIPEINIKIEKDALTNKAVPTIKGMSTILDNKGFKNIVDKYLGEKVNTETISDLENKLFNDIKIYCESPSDELMIEIFHGIQLWGGRSGRNIYVMGGGFENNFSKEAYKNLVNNCLKGNLRTILESLIRFGEEVQNLGLAFITKHTRYWTSQNKHLDILPIYDSVMSKGFLKEDNPRLRDLEVYWKTMLTYARNNNLTTEILERSLFNYFREINK
jgi:hypothetical protein